MLDHLVILFAFAAGPILPSQPPVRLGLWEASQTMSTSRATPPDTAPPMVRLRECVTQATWDKNFSARPNPTCTRSNESYANGHYVADFACPNGSGHIDTHFLTPEAVQIHSRMTVVTHGHTVTVEGLTDLHFVSTACGSVRPGQPLILH